jgi:esterase/lipase
MSGTLLPKPFEGSEHNSFLWEGNNCAALLIHGFPGTPAEMRTLGKLLRDAGWTVHGLMLPGLGADLENLESRMFKDWVNAAREAIEALQRSHSRLMIVGYSMGGAVAINIAADHSPAGLVLLAPFWSLAEGWLSLLWPVLRLLRRRVNPLQRADFSASEVRHGLQRMYRNIDLDDPQTQNALRKISVSLSPIDQVRRLGHRAYEQAVRINTPKLVIQGRWDQVVSPRHTKKLLLRFPNAVQYHEVDAGHDIIDPESCAWNQVRDHLLRFAEAVRSSPDARMFIDMRSSTAL